MDNIAVQLETIESIKNDIKSAIIEKGGTVTDAFGGYAQAIKDLPTGGGGGNDSFYSLIEGRYFIISDTKLTVIGSYALASQRNLIEVNAPNVSEVHSYAFVECSNLSKVYLPNAIFPNAVGAFTNCVKLTSLVINFPSVIHTRMFNYCSSMSEYDLAGVKTIGIGAFENNTNLRRVDFRSVETISDRAFSYCIKLEEINLSTKVRFGQQAFMYCSKLQKATMLAENIPMNLFGGCFMLKDVYLKNNAVVPISYIGDSRLSPFSACHSELSIYVPESLYNAYISSYGSYSVRLSNLRSYRYFSEIFTPYTE